MVDTVDDNPLRFEFNAKDDPMRKIDQMADFEGEFLVFRNYRTALWEFFERIDCLHESAKPSLRCLRFFFDITNEPNILFCIGQRRFCDVNQICQVFPEVLLAPVARA